MAFEEPTGSEIRASRRNAVGGGRKRCKKGKNCSAACIQAGMYCLVDMPEPAAIATTKVAGMLEKLMSGKLPAPAAPTAEKLKPMAAAPVGRTEAQKMGAQTKQARKKAEEDKLKQRMLDSMRANQAKQGFGKPKPQNPEDLKPLRGPASQKQTTAQKGSDLLKQLQAEGKAQKATPAKPTSATPAAGKVQKATTGKTPSTVPGPAAGDWRTRFNGLTPQLDFELNKLQQTIDKLPPEQQAYWNKQIQEKLGLKGSVPVHTNGKPYTESEIAKAYVSQARGWNGMIKDGAPKMLADREVGTVKAPKGMIPDTTFTGQRKWISPQDGLVYSAPKTPADKAAGVWGQNRAATKDTLRRLPEITDFRRGQRDKGENWPTQQLPPRPGMPKSVDEVIAKLTPEEKAAIMFNGLNKTDKEGKLLIEWYKANPQQAEARFRETVQRWYDQGGRSGISGMPVAIPGLKAKEGEARSSVDHFNPISTGKAFTAADLRKQLDNYKNFLVAEEGPNSNRSNKPWDSWLDNKGKGGAKTSKAKTPTLRSLNEEQKEKVSAATQLMNSRIDKRLNEGQLYDAKTNAEIKTRNQRDLAPFEKMSANEKAALNMYGENKEKYYLRVNSLLRNGDFEGSTPEGKQMAQFISGNLRSGLEKLPPAKVEELNRAVSGNFTTALGKLKPGDVIEDKGFGSYTDSKTKGRVLDTFFKRDQPNAVIRIVNPKTIREVAPAMPYKTEGEHISLPGTRYRLVDVNDKVFYSGKTMSYIPQYTFEEI